MVRNDLHPYAFVLAVRNMRATAKYLVDVLGFEPQWSDGENWQAVARGGVRIMLGHCPDAMPASALGDHSYFAYLDADDVDVLHMELLDRGALILAAPADKPWGRREMALAMPEGHRIMIGQSLGTGPTLKAASAVAAGQQR